MFPCALHVDDVIPVSRISFHVRIRKRGLAVKRELPALIAGLRGGGDFIQLVCSPPQFRAIDNHDDGNSEAGEPPSKFYIFAEYQNASTQTGPLKQRTILSKKPLILHSQILRYMYI